MNFIRILILLIFPILGISQAPTKINFQSVLRNTNGEVVSNSAVSLKISILSGTITGSAVYIETHAKTTDAGGLMSLQIGGGTVLSGVFGNINWGSSAHFIKLEADFSGGNSYVLLGTQELMSVPYALYASYASKTDTSALNLTSRFDTKLNIVDTAKMLETYINVADTSYMLLAYRTGLNNKLNWIDTTNMLSKYLRKADTSSLSERINSKLSSTVFPYYPGPEKGYIMYWNGSRWVLLYPGAAGQVLKMSSDNDPVPVWGTDATTSVPAFSPCGAPISDIDGNVYNTVLIGAQCWTKENLRVRRYNNGTAIPFDAIGGSGGSSSTWQNLTIGAHTIFAHDSLATPSNLTKYGYLYNWYAAKGISTGGTIFPNDTLRICPTGWHVPTDTEWTTLTTELGGESVAGGKMKSIGTVSYWNSPNEGATNSSGFSALPGGYRIKDGSFNNLSNSAVFWRATEVNDNNAWSSRLEHNSNNVSRNSYEKQYGASIRCLKD